MLYPSINKLMENVDSRYTLVTVTAKRARALADSESVEKRYDSDKYVSLAVQEIADGKIVYTKNRP